MRYISECNIDDQTPPLDDKINIFSFLHRRELYDRWYASVDHKFCNALTLCRHICVVAVVFVDVVGNMLYWQKYVDTVRMKFWSVLPKHKGSKLNIQNISLQTLTFRRKAQAIQLIFHRVWVITKRRTRQRNTNNSNKYTSQNLPISTSKYLLWSKWCPNPLGCYFCVLKEATNTVFNS